MMAAWRCALILLASYSEWPQNVYLDGYDLGSYVPRTVREFVTMQIPVDLQNDVLDLIAGSC